MEGVRELVSVSACSACITRQLEGGGAKEEGNKYNKKKKGK